MGYVAVRTASLVGFATVSLPTALFYDNGYQKVFSLATWQSFEFRVYALTTLATALGMLGAACFVFCMATGGNGPLMNKMVAISSMYTVVSAVLSLIFLGDPITIETIFGLAFAMLGILALTLSTPVAADK